MRAHLAAPCGRDPWDGLLELEEHEHLRDHPVHRLTVRLVDVEVILAVGAIAIDHLAAAVEAMIVVVVVVVGEGEEEGELGLELEVDPDRVGEHVLGVLGVLDPGEGPSRLRVAP
jgi:hypothetical protein